MKNMVDYEKDPRAELEGDHVLWVALLTTARGTDKTDSETGLFGVLHALRCGGAALERDRDFGMLISAGEWDKAQYDAFRAKYLAPRRVEVVQALKAAAAILPKAQNDTLRARTTARVNAAEAKALALGWSRDELWSEKEWTDQADGRRRESLYKALLSASQTWGNVEVGMVTAESIEFLVPKTGLSAETVSLRLYRVSPAVKLLGDPTASQASATLKKEAATGA